MEAEVGKKISQVRKLVSELYHGKGKYIPICLFDLAQRPGSLLIKTLIEIKVFLPKQHTQSVCGFIERYPCLLNINPFIHPSQTDL